MKVEQDELLINNLINNEELSTNQYLEIRDPGRLTDVVGKVAQATIEDVDKAVQAAHKAFQEWRKTTLDERKQLLLKAAHVLDKEAPNIVTTLVREQGVLKKMTADELMRASTVIRNTIDIADSFFQIDRFKDEESQVNVEKRPMGVILGMIPWNAPVILAMQKLAPVLITGNTIVIKPSPNAPLGISMLLKKIAKLFPPGVINVINGGAEVGSALCKHPLIRKISFTGGGTTAKTIMKAAAETLKGIHFELGGNDPALVLDDVNLDEVVPKIISAAFRRSGQVCFAVKRIYVPENMYDSFYDKVCQFVSEYKIGHGLDERSTLSPVNNELQYKYVKNLIEKTKHSNAKVVELGEKLNPDQWDNGYYLHPVVIRDLDPRQEIVTCEQFGPVVPLVSYRSEEEVIKMINDTEYGLSSSIWTQNMDRAEAIMRDIDAGGTFINRHVPTSLGLKYMPIGGTKQSGIGRENTAVGLAEYVEYHASNRSL